MVAPRVQRRRIFVVASSVAHASLEIASRAGRERSAAVIVLVRPHRKTVGRTQLRKLNSSDQK